MPRFLLRQIYRVSVLCFIAGTVLLASGLGAVTLAWDPNAEPDLAGYRVYYGTKQGVYGVPVTTTATSLTLPPLQPGTTYYFVVTAYNSAELESAPSEEISVMMPSAEVGTDAEKDVDGDGDGLPDSWETAHGLDAVDAGGAGSPTQGAVGDPDCDGIPNFLEYAFDSDPYSAGREALPRAELSWNAIDGRSHAMLTFTARTDTDRLSYLIETSTDLRTWTPASYERISAAESPSSAGGTNERVTLRMLPAIDERTGAALFRVRVEANGG